MSDFQLGEEGIGTDVGVVRGAGYLDFDAAPLLKELIASRIDAGARHLIVDLAEVAFIDSTVVGVLMGGLKRVAEWGGTVSIVSVNDNVGKIFEIMGLDDVMPLHRTRDDALSALPQAA